MSQVRRDAKLSKHFRQAEFRCRCRRIECDAPEMDKGFIQRLEALRVDWGEPLSPSSGARCKEWNARVNGAEHSRHLTGHAADFNFKDHVIVRKFVALAEKHGFNGIGTGKILVHLDDRDTPARWTYQD
jgi:uncharacterized protein YcbK (DUF882 family)